MARVRVKKEDGTKLISGHCVGALAPFSEGSQGYINEHPDWSSCTDETHKGPPYRSGGGLFIAHEGWKHLPARGVYVRHNDTNWFRGDQYCTQLSASYSYNSQPTPFFSAGWHTEGAARANGTRAISRMRPGNPVANVGQAVTEAARGGVPRNPFSGAYNALRLMRQRSFVENARNAGSDYLNVEFGWKPFLKDLQETVKLTLSLDHRLKQLARDNGKKVRRRLKLPGKPYNGPTSTSSGTALAYALKPTLHSFFYAGGSNKGGLTVSEHGSDDAWVSGAFKYWIPDIGGSAWTKRATAALYGLTPTPSLLWEVLPWSWLIDWHSNVGEILKNLSANAAENLVMEYGFSMFHKYTLKNYEQWTTYIDGSQGRASLAYVKETKVRVLASPYSFDIGLPNYSDRQIAILASLGLTRA